MLFIILFFSPLYSINCFMVNLNILICFFLSVGLRIKVRTFTSSYQLKVSYLKKFQFLKTLYRFKRILGGNERVSRCTLQSKRRSVIKWFSCHAFSCKFFEVCFLFCSFKLTLFLISQVSIKFVLLSNFAVIFLFCFDYACHYNLWQRLLFAISY